MTQCLQYNTPEKDTQATQCQMIMNKSQRSSQLVQARLAKHLKPAIYAFTLVFYIEFLFMYPLVICHGTQQRKERVTLSSRDNTSNLRRYLRMSSISNTSTVYASIFVITLLQINWNKQDVSVGLRSTTCSFDLSCPLNMSREKLSTRHDTSAQGSLDCLFGTGKHLRMLQSSGEIQAPWNQKHNRTLSG